MFLFPFFLFSFLPFFLPSFLLPPIFSFLPSFLPPFLIFLCFSPEKPHGMGAVSRNVNPMESNWEKQNSFSFDGATVPGKLNQPSLPSCLFSLGLFLQLKSHKFLFKGTKGEPKGTRGYYRDHTEGWDQEIRTNKIYEFWCSHPRYTCINVILTNTHKTLRNWTKKEIILRLFINYEVEHVQERFVELHKGFENQTNF